MSDDLKAAFLQRVEQTENCWLWRGNKGSCGYGAFKHNGKNMRAHRMSYLLFCGDLEDGKFICHRCDNPACVRPEHLFQGTPKENTQDMVAKGRAATGLRNGQAKLSDDDVEQIRKLIAQGLSRRTIGARFGVDHSMITHIHKGRYRRLTAQSPKEHEGVKG